MSSKYLIPIFFLIGCIIAFHFLRQDKQSKIVFFPNVEKIVNEISQNSREEFTLCLSYFQFGNYRIIYNYDVPEINKTTKMSVNYDSCEDGYNIMWHNHPHFNMENEKLQKNYKLYYGEKLDHPSDLLALSRADIRSGIKGGYDYIIVSADADNYSWWTKVQIWTAFFRGYYILETVDGQTVTSE